MNVTIDLPFSIGDTLYIVSPSEYITTCVVRNIRVNSLSEIWVEVEESSRVSTCMYSITLDELRSISFTSKDEAIKAF